MAYDKFLIAPIDKGLQTNMKSWMIADNAFERLQNAYTFRGRVRKRFGSYLLNNSVAVGLRPLYSRLRINFGNTDGAGNFAAGVDGVVYKVGQQFSVGTEIFTVTTAGVQPMLSTGAGAGTYDTGLGIVTIVGATPATAVYFYTSEPVMGFATFEQAAINDESTYAYDTQFAYQFTGGGWERLAGETVPGDALWTGTNAQFFWSAIYQGATPDIKLLFTTNFNVADGLRYFDGANWTSFSPAYTVAANNNIITARIIVQFHGRLLLLNTIETVATVNTVYQNRCRYSQFGSPLDVLAWREDIPGRGSWIDAPVEEAIVTAQLLKDRLIVYFERSTWELVYTGNQILPFIWQQINIELGAESTFSMVAFDRDIFGIGNVGIHACNGAYVERVDDEIPDEVFNITNVSDGVERVHGIREYFSEMVYWTYPSIDSGNVYPNRVLVYNYKNGAWAYNDDSITAFGYFQNVGGVTWADSYYSWANAIGAWQNATYKAKFRNVIAGNQEGFTFITDINTSRNAPVLQITNITNPAGVVTLSIIDHNLTTGDYILIENALGQVVLNDGIYQVQVVDANTVILPTIIIVGGPYTGQGTAARVSNINILTKQYNFYNQEATNIFLAQVDFNVDRTANGQIIADSSPSSSNRSMRADGLATGAILGDNILETSPYPLNTLETSQNRLWHRIYFQTEGNCVQLDLYMNYDQMTTPVIALSDFQLNGMIFYATKTSEIE